MSTGWRIFGIAAVLAASTAGAAMAQCPPGYMLYGGMCQPAAPAPGAYAPNNPVSGAAAGAASGAAAGNAAAGPIGGIVGGALGTATGAIAGTANAVTGAPMMPVGPAPTPTCPPGRSLYNGYCY